MKNVTFISLCLVAILIALVIKLTMANKEALDNLTRLQIENDFYRKDRKVKADSLKVLREFYANLVRKNARQEEKTDSLTHELKLLRGKKFRVLPLTANELTEKLTKRYEK